MGKTTTAIFCSGKMMMLSGSEYPFGMNLEQRITNHMLLGSQFALSDLS